VGYGADGEFYSITGHTFDHGAGMPAGRSFCDSHLQEQDGQCVVVGDPTEGALIVAAGKAGLTQQALEQEMPRLDTIPFESDFQYMATLHKSKPDQLIYVKGSTEAILKRCAQRLNTEGRLVPLDRTQVEGRCMAEQGYVPAFKSQ